jgi:hypothetical protein
MILIYPRTVYPCCPYIGKQALWSDFEPSILKDKEFLSAPLRLEGREDRE